MSEDTIIIEIDDSQLDIALVKLDLLGTQTTRVFGRAEPLRSSLPTINREMRVILGQLPGMRQAIQLLFRAKRLERGLLIRALGEGSMQLYLTLIATAIVLIQQIQAHQRRLEKAQRDYENRIRRARGWTQEEFIRGRQDWENYLKGLPP
jgi:hypothetical protein